VNIAGKPVTRGPLVDRPRQRPADLIDARPIDEPWAPTPAYRMPAADVAGHMRLCQRGHLAAPGKPCRWCVRTKPRAGGWDVVCEGRR
jgi:hypothetical protein